MSSILSTDVVDILPGELQARLEADDYFCDIAVAIMEKGSVHYTIAAKQAVLAGKGGKNGVAVLIPQIEADDDYPEQALGPLTLRPAFLVMEQVEMNNDAGGTKKSARQVARRIRDVIKTCALEGIITELTTENPVIHAVPLKADDAQNLIVYQVNFKCYECEADAPTLEVDYPTIDVATGSMVLACGTAGAAIYYTLDDSFPVKGNIKATLYAGPTAIPPAGTHVRFCAYLKGLIASRVQRGTIT